MHHLRREQSGAVMVMATFFAIFLVAIVYHVAGVGGACLEQQIMQDAADATVFSAATVNARGMNLIALINLIMAAIMAVLVALRLVQAILTVATAIFIALCAIPWTSAVGCPLVTPLTDATVEIADIADEVEDIVHEVLPALNQAADVVNEVVPYLAELEAIYVSRQYNPPATVGFVWPVTDGLPTRDGEFQTLCEQAGGMIVDIAFFFLPDDSAIGEQLGGMMEGLVGTFQNYFCGGDSSGGPPSTSRQVAVSYPAEERDSCRPEDGSTTVRDDYLCQEGYGGAITTTCDCEGRGDCEGCSRAGCDYCFDRRGTGSFESGLWTRRRDQWREYYDTDTGTWRFQSWIVRDRRITISREGDPCRDAEWLGDCATGQPTLFRDDDALVAGDAPPQAPPAICVQARETDAYTDSAGVFVREIRRTSWLYLHSCQIRRSVEIVADGNPIEGGEDKVPRELDEQRYLEVSKMRGIVIGEADATQRLKGVGVATRASRDGVGGRLSVAAAEYFSRHGDLWHMDWRARLIRFRMAYDSSESEGEGEGAGGPTGDVSGGGGDGAMFSGGGAGEMGGGGPFSGCVEGAEAICEGIQNRIFGDGSGNGSDLLNGGSTGGLSLEDYILH